MLKKGKFEGVKMEKELTLVKKSRSQNNPFEIQSGVILTGSRHSSNLLLKYLLEKVRELPVSKEVSILIPKTVVDKASEASNLVLALKRAIAKDATFPENFTITMRTFKDIKGNYLNTRVWRIH